MNNNMATIMCKAWYNCSLALQSSFEEGTLHHDLSLALTSEQPEKVGGYLNAVSDEIGKVFDKHSATPVDLASEVDSLPHAQLFVILGAIARV